MTSLVIAAAAVLGAGPFDSPENVAALAARYGARRDLNTPHGGRCDLYTDTHVIDVADLWRWPEAVGYALYFAADTGKRPGIVLGNVAATKQRDWHTRAALAVCRANDITLWVEPDNGPGKPLHVPGPGIPRGEDLWR